MIKKNLFLIVALLSTTALICYGSEDGEKEPIYAGLFDNLDDNMNAESREIIYTNKIDYLNALEEPKKLRKEKTILAKDKNKLTIADRLKEARPKDHNLMNQSSLEKELAAMEYRKKHGDYTRLSPVSLNAFQQKVVEYNIGRLSKQRSNKKTSRPSLWLEDDKDWFLKV